MPLPIKSRYTIHEAARYIASATGEKITISQIIDWGTQGFYGLYLLTNDCHVKYEDAADVVEISGALVKFHPNATQAATLENGYPIEIESGLHEGRKVIFMKSPMQLHHNKFGDKEKPAHFNSTSMMLLGTELTAFTASIAKPANAPAAMVVTLPNTSPSGDDVEEQAPAKERSISKGAVINAFEGLHFDRNGWNNALSDVPNWIEPCRVTLGRKGDKTTPATWNPALIAAALFDKEISIKKLDAVFVRLKDWADEWREVSASFRD